MIPLCFILPILMWTVYNKDVASTRRKAVNWALIATFSLLSVVATVGSGGPAARGPAAFPGVEHHHQQQLLARHFTTGRPWPHF